MTTHTYLKQVDRYERMIANKQLEIENLRTNATNITVASDTERVKSSGNKDKIGTMAVLITDLEKEVRALEFRKRRILQQIDSIEDTREYDVITWMYILHRDIQEIADHLDCSVSNVKRIKSLALENFENQYGKYYLNATPNYITIY